MKLYSIAILAIVFFPAALGSDGFAAQPLSDKLVFIVDEGTSFDGITNKIEKIAWHPGITLGDVLTLSHSFSASVFILLAKDVSTVYKGHALLYRVTSKVAISPDDVVVIGGVDSKRAEQLDHIPEVHQRLGVKWSEYKHWMHRKAPKPEVSPSP